MQASTIIVRVSSKRWRIAVKQEGYRRCGSLEVWEPVGPKFESPHDARIRLADIGQKLIGCREGSVELLTTEQVIGELTID